MKYANESQISLIAEEVGGAVAAAQPGAQIELLNTLIDGCKEAVEIGSFDPKVGYVNNWINFASGNFFGILNLK